MNTHKILSVLVAFIMVAMLSGCGAMSTGPVEGSLCYGIEDSLICNVTNGDPRAVDSILMAANFAAIRKDVYTSQQALDVINDIEVFIGEDKIITYQDLVNKIAVKLEDAGALLFIVSPYFDDLNKPLPISAFDTGLFLAHLEHQKGLILAFLAD